MPSKETATTMGSLLRKLFVEPTKNAKIHFIRYGFVAVVAFAVDFGFLYIFTSYFHFYYLLSAVLSFSLSVLVNYLLSVLWVFTARDARKRSIEVTLFLLICLIALLLNIFLIWFFTSVLLVYYLVSKIIAVIIVFFWSFAARRFIFHSKFMRKYFPDLVVE